RRRTTQPRDDAGPHRLEGQVIDAAEQPVGGVSVGLDTKPPRVTQTEADGSFVFEGLAERTYRVGASKDDHRADAVAVRVGPAGEPVTLRLRRGNAMLVRVQDEREAPIAGARVLRRGLIVRDQRTGADGTTLLRALGSAWERIEVTADGYAPGFIGAAMPPMSEVAIERVVTLYTGASVRGVVRDPEGAPVAGARISIGNSELHVTSGADGGWVMPAVRAGTHTFVARADGFAPGSSAQELDGETPRDGVDIALQRGLTISGRVVDEDGTAVGGAKLSVAIGFARFDAWADDVGEFKLTGLRDGVHELAAFHGDRASNAIEADASEQPAEVELVVIDSTIRGVVVDDIGEPVPDADIWAMRGNVDSNLRGEDDAVTDSAGRFVLGPLVIGDYEVNAIYPGGDERRLLGPMVSARTGQEDVRVVLPRRASIRGRVIRGGTAVSSFVASIDDFHRADYRDASVFARADGSFELENVPPGKYHLAFAGESFARHIISDLRVETGEVLDLGAIEVAAGRTIRGRVLVGEREPVEGALVQIGPTR
ncbi:MAG: carboxypeptidase-like regulatory domain-containing protein, partial [Actinobacteria bacterium]|nr:carboxypeptidase-like regulatory domain-containing protein [Actinomycetota bacterium]